MILIFLSGVYGRVEYTKSSEFFRMPFLRHLRSTIFRPRVTKSPDFFKNRKCFQSDSLSCQELSTNVFMIKKNFIQFIIIQFISKLSCKLPQNAVFWSKYHHTISHRLTSTILHLMSTMDYQKTLKLLCFSGGRLFVLFDSLQI